MGDLIAIPLPSERRAALVLAALRRLEAEYRVGPPPSGGVRSWIASLVRVRLRQARQGLRDLRRGAAAAVVGGIIGLTVAAACAASVVESRWSWDRPGPLPGAPHVLLPGLGLGLALGLAFYHEGGRHARRRAQGASPGGAAGGAGDVSWLISYVTLEPDGTGSGQVRASVLRITLPEAAEWRLRAILERAGATAAR